ncbi:hypothetical protein E8E13_010239 [Curvularia kusanoi]|uniref:Uncharacterized protein n=1 Tax=Curvularia kusanoi TaxID=90978 RepID=A0A9P4THL7_CURKU|nr:hypothetical protein E8E13_010239 [Curvularia kusanoi]
MNLDFAFQALAYPASNLSDAEFVSPCPCSLIFRCGDAKFATLLLVARIPTAHSPETQFVLQYDADNMKSHTLDDILPVKGKGKKRPDIKTLDLSTSASSSLWCPATDFSFGSRPGYEFAFQQFVDLAKATRVNIVFDFHHVRQEHRGMFKAFSKAAQGLVGYPVQASLVEQGLRKATWAIFAPTEAAGAPPAYEDDDSRARKRARRDSPGSPVRLGRGLTPQSPAASYSSDKTVPFSPATEAENLRRLRGFDPQAEAINAIIEKQLPANLDNVQALQKEAIDAAIARQLPAYFANGLHTEAIDVAVSKQVGKALEALLPNALEEFFNPKSQPGSPATSFTSFDSSGHRYTKLPALTPVGKMMLPHLRTHLIDQFHLYQKQQLQRFEKLANKTFESLARSAYDARAQEYAEFAEDMEEHKAEISLLKKDTIDDLWREGQGVLDQGKEACAETYVYGPIIVDVPE